MNDNTHSTREVSLPPGVSYSELRRKFHILKNVSKREFLSRPQLQIQVLGERLDGGEQTNSPQPGTQLSAGVGMPTQNIPEPQGQPQQFAYGGSYDQQTNNEGLVEFAGGGTHEQNSNGGIPQGYDNKGNLNTVEDGETKYSFDDGEYIFSNRISTDGKFESAQQAAQATPMANIKQYAQGGGLSGSDRGSDSNPYPSVSKGDFAGGGRSYPIPTEADAVDALRLAGLHGRDDVRANVFAKYPQLQHADGGFLDKEMDDYHDTLYNTPIGDDFANSEPLESPLTKTLQRAYGGNVISHMYGAGNNLAYAEGGPMNPPVFNQAPQGSMDSIAAPVQNTVMDNIIKTAPKKVDPRFANAKPVLNERGLALTKNETIEKPKQADTTNVVKEGELYEKHINDEVTSRVNKYNKRSNNLDVQPEHIDASSAKAPKDIKAIQQQLVDAGYNLNPKGKFANQGVDGKMGAVTKAALEEFNKSGEKGKYTSYKSGVGELGECKETQCSEYTQNEIFRNLKPNVDRKTWNAKTGLTGDAWTIGKNIEKAGGKKINTKDVREGDVITMFTGNSPYINQAKKHGTDATHIGVVDKINPDGSYYVLHNVHVQDRLTGNYEGREKRTLVTPDGKVHTSKEGHFLARAAYRPAYDNVDITGKTAKVREDVGLQLDKSREKELQTMDKSLLGSDVKEKVSAFMEPLNSINNKRVLAQKHNLSETEYQSLAKASMGILGQESSYDTSAKRLPKQMAANFLNTVGIKEDETSRGAGQLKYGTNYGNSDLTELGINKGNFTENKHVPLVTLDLLAGNYRKYINEGLTKEKALYKAVEKYNRGHASKNSDTQDSDYVNKVMHYAGMFDTVDKEGTHYNTLVDKVNLNKNTIKRQRKLSSK